MRGIQYLHILKIRRIQRVLILILLSLGPTLLRLPKKRSAWAHDRDHGRSWWATIPQKSWFSELDFVHSYRVRRSTFERLCCCLSSVVPGITTKLRQPVPLHTLVAICLERCATGNCFNSIAKNYNYARNTCWKAHNTVSSAIAGHLFQHWIKFPSTEAQFVTLTQAFQRRRGLINCVGAMDGT